MIPPALHCFTHTPSTYYIQSKPTVLIHSESVIPIDFSSNQQYVAETSIPEAVLVTPLSSSPNLPALIQSRPLPSPADITASIINVPRTKVENPPFTPKRQASYLIPVSKVSELEEKDPCGGLFHDKSCETVPTSTFNLISAGEKMWIRDTLSSGLVGTGSLGTQNVKPGLDGVSSPSGISSKKHLAVILGSVFGFVLLILAISYYIYQRLRSPQTLVQALPQPGDISLAEKQRCGNHYMAMPSPVSPIFAKQFELNTIGGVRESVASSAFYPWFQQSIPGDAQKIGISSRPVEPNSHVHSRTSNPVDEASGQLIFMPACMTASDNRSQVSSTASSIAFAQPVPSTDLSMAPTTFQHVGIPTNVGPTGYYRPSPQPNPTGQSRSGHVEVGPRYLGRFRDNSPRPLQFLPSLPSLPFNLSN